MYAWLAVSMCLFVISDYLLCHDDQLEDRRIAFIFYLVQDWTAQDGGK